MKKNLFTLLFIIIGLFMSATLVACYSETPTTSETPVVTPEIPTTSEAPVVTPEIPTTSEAPVVTPDVPNTSETPVVTPEVPTTDEVPTTSKSPADTTETPITSLPTTLEHQHTYGNWSVSRKATCTDEGKKVRKCSCGASETAAIPATGHSFSSWTVSLKATCTDEGKKVRKCSCGTSETAAIPATGHSFGSWTVSLKATCTDEGKKVRKCSCGTSETAAIPATGHSFGNWIITIKATTISEGEKEQTCSSCGAIICEKIAMLPATPNEEEWIASRFIDLLNNERICANAQTLITGNRITAIAQERAEELAENYSHYRPNGASGITIYNDYQYGVCFDWTQIPGMEEYGIEYKPSLSGEDIACIGSANGTADNIAKRLVQAFRTSHSHWTDLLKTDYSAAGVGVRFVEKEDGTYKVYVAVLLIDRLYE